MNQTFQYRLYTERLNEGRLRELVGSSFENYSIFNGVGLWHGQEESVVVFEIIDDSLGALSVIKSLIDLIKAENNQEAVLVERTPIESWLF